MICTRCKKHDAIVHTTFESYCEDCALDVSLALLSVCRLSDTAIKALVAAGWELPVTTAPHHTASQLAAEFGVSPQKIGRLANKHCIKNDQFGEWRLDKAAHSHKQIQTFHYNDHGKAKIAELLRGNDQ